MKDNNINIEQAISYIKEDNRKQRNLLLWQVPFLSLMGISKAIDLFSVHPSGDPRISILMLTFTVAALPLVIARIWHIFRISYSEPTEVIRNTQKSHSTIFIIKQLVIFSMLFFPMLTAVASHFKVNFLAISTFNISILAGITLGIIAGAVICRKKRRETLRQIETTM